MNRKQAEKMLKRMAEAAELLAGAQATLAETNAMLVDALIQSLSKAWADDASKQVQFWNGNAWENVEGAAPLWNPVMQYRFKPDPRTARDLAIAEAVRSACMHARFTIPGEEGIDLAAIITTVKD